MRGGGGDSGKEGGGGGGGGGRDGDGTVGGSKELRASAEGRRRARWKTDAHQSLCLDRPPQTLSHGLLLFLRVDYDLSTPLPPIALSAPWGQNCRIF